MKGKIDRKLLPQRNLPAMLYAISLVHDLGNPPFGHQGEVAIQQWFKANRAKVLDAKQPKEKMLTEAMKQDFLSFEGNAQTFRLVSRLQIVNDDRGLNLTYGTLGALLKYTVPSNRVRGKDAEYAGARKHGYFQSEVPIIAEVRRKTGLSMGVRHPLTYVMEACDDIAYSVIDAEDALKKGLASFPDLLEWLNQPEKKDEPDLANGGKRRILDEVIKKGSAIREELRTSSAGRGLSPGELNDVSMQMFRAHVISVMVQAVADAFVSHLDELMTGEFTGDLMSKCDASLVTARLKRFDKAVAYRNREVLRLEARGTAVLNDLMNTFWASITDRVDRSDPGSARCTAESTYVYSRISENYRRAFESAVPSHAVLPLRYRECQLLTDMISGMTDRFAMSLHEELRGQGFLRSRP
jgi:dGTPase